MSGYDFFFLYNVLQFYNYSSFIIHYFFYRVLLISDLIIGFLKLRPLIEMDI